VGFCGLLCDVSGDRVGGLGGEDELQDNELRVVCDHCLQLVEVGQPAIIFFTAPEVDLCAQAFRDRVQLLICRVMADDMVSLLQQCIEYQVVGRNRSIGDEDVVRREWRSNFARV